jgi:hypothetical protein
VAVAVRVAEMLTEVLLAPARPVDEVAWCSALAEARRVLARVAVRRAGAGTFRVTDHEVRVALSHGGGAAEDEPFAWSARTARRSLGLAAVRTLVADAARSPAEAVRARVAESSELVRDGSPAVSGLDRWLAALAPAGRAAVGAAAVTWATRLWCALDWDAFAAAPVIGRDRWWDSPDSALLALRGRAEVRSDSGSLVVLSGPRRDSVRAELALVPLVEALRPGNGGMPGRVVGWWPDSGRVVRVEAEPALLTLGAEAVALVVARTAVPARAAA